MGLILEAADIGPIGPLGVCPEMIVTEVLQPGQHRIDPRFLRDEGRKGCIIVAGGLRVMSVLRGLRFVDAASLP